MGYQNLYDLQRSSKALASNADVLSNPMIIYLSMDKQSCSPLRESLSGTGIPMIESRSIYHVQQELVSKYYSVCVIRCLAVSDVEFELLNFIKKHNLSTRVVISAHAGNIDLAVRLMKAGAIDFIVSETPDTRLANAILQQSMQKTPKMQPAEKPSSVIAPVRTDNGQSKEEFPLIGQSRAISDLRATIKLVAKSKASVLITGESGTGKEIVARQIHQYSDRTGKPCIPLNCAALPANIIENELFGHEKGAFSGAISKKAGAFEMADQGILFLDEIAEMDLDNQAKLLRVLESRSYRRLGGKDEVKVDVKVVAATNQNIQEAIQAGTFREDLYYRLGVIEIEIPALRERKEDIIPLVSYFLDELSVQYEKGVQRFSEECMDILLAYDWPGNVRELRNVVERAIVMCQEEEISAAYLPARIRTQAPVVASPAVSLSFNPSSRPMPVRQTSGMVNAPHGADSIRIPIGSSTQDAERILILQTLASVDYNKTKTAQILGISRKTLHNKINALFPGGLEAATGAQTPASQMAQAV